jgi:hypothetical protein
MLQLVAKQLTNIYVVIDCLHITSLIYTNISACVMNWHFYYATWYFYYATWHFYYATTPCLAGRRHRTDRSVFGKQLFALIFTDVIKPCLQQALLCFVTAQLPYGAPRCAILSILHLLPGAKEPTFPQYPQYPTLKLAL